MARPPESAPAHPSGRAIIRIPRFGRHHAVPVRQGVGDGVRLITLTTCAELFHTDDRMAAFGHLVAARIS